MSSLQRSLSSLYIMITVRTHRVIFVLDLTMLTCSPHKCPTVELKHDRIEDVWEHDGMFRSHLRYIICILFLPLVRAEQSCSTHSSEEHP